MSDAWATVAAAVILQTGIVVSALVAYQLKNRGNEGKKTKADAYVTLLDAISKSGKTIEDLMTMIAELPSLRQKLSDALHEAGDYQTKLASLEQQLNDDNKLIAELKARDANREREMQDEIRKSSEFRDSVAAIVGAAEEKIKALQIAYDVIKKEHDEWRAGITVLLAQMTEAKIKPRWVPTGVSMPDMPPTSGRLIKP